MNILTEIYPEPNLTCLQARSCLQSKKKRACKYGIPCLDNYVQFVHFKHKSPTLTALLYGLCAVNLLQSARKFM